MGHQLNLKAFFQNGEMTVVLLREKNSRSSSLGMMFQNTCKKHYVDSSKNITFSFSAKKLGKNATMKTIYNAIRGSDMLSTSTMFRGVCHY
jgi:hypothetical protein